MRDYMASREQLQDGTMAKETARIATEVQSALRLFQESVDPKQLQEPRQALAAPVTSADSGNG